ncbi:hypothetical protein OKW12_003667 [Pseudomonas silensiensis]|nr:hypothetical protein [Pseudomonas silensiensis]
MSSSTPTNTSKLDRILADNQRDKEMGYRDKALKMYPHVCGRCAREFSGKRLSELTVHHRDHNHDNNRAGRLELGIVVPVLPRQRTLAVYRPAVFSRRLAEHAENRQGDA